jgi:hypothetical protein
LRKGRRRQRSGRKSGRSSFGRNPSKSQNGSHIFWGVRGQSVRGSDFQATSVLTARRHWLCATACRHTPDNSIANPPRSRVLIRKHSSRCPPDGLGRQRIRASAARTRTQRQRAPTHARPNLTQETARPAFLSSAPTLSRWHDARPHTYDRAKPSPIRIDSTSPPGTVSTPHHRPSLQLGARIDVT